MATVTKASPREAAEAKYKLARAQLLFAAIITLMNIVLLFLDIDTFYLFSAIFPYFVVVIGMTAGLRSWLIISCCIAAVSIGVYFLCWLLSKKRSGWLIAACVLYGIDTVLVGIMYLANPEAMFLTAGVFHILLLVYMIMGIAARNRAKKLPQEAEQPAPQPDYTPYIRRADMEVRSRVFLEACHAGHSIQFRRVKRVNELVIDGYVYDEIEMRIEPAHSLSARIGGHTFEVGYDGKAMSYFKYDGEIQIRKVRWY